jgi:fibronectin type 3 domain-containing protein
VAQINLTWTDVTSETGYKVERSLDGVTFAPLVTLSADTTSYSDLTVAANTKYYYRIRATNGVGDSANSTVATATTPQVPPAAPGTLAAVATSTQVKLTWADNSNNEDGFRIERSSDNVSFTQLGSNLAAGATTFTDLSVIVGQTYYYRVVAFNIAGSSAASNVASATIPAAPVSSWVDGDIGAVGAAGSSSLSNGVYTVKGSGADIYGTADAFHYLSQSKTGDCTMIVRVGSLVNTDANAKAGIVFRESNAANAKEVALVVTPLNGVRLLTRSTTGGTIASTGITGKTPVWLKLVRVGSTFTGYASSDGVNWTLVGSKSITMNATISVGMGVTSHKAGTLTTATFDNVSLV